MSFYLRKSIKVGPVRFNLSKSGIGVSGGVKGFRVGTGPRGNYIHMGRGGLYYRKTFPSVRQGTAAAGEPAFRGSSPPLLWTPANEPLVPPVQMSEIESADVSGMVHSSSAELLRELDEKSKIPRLGPWALGGAVCLMLLALCAPLHPLLLSFLGLGLVCGVYYVFRLDELRKTVVLMYDFDPMMEQVFASLHACADQLAQCAGCWHKAASGNVHDSKYHGGASHLVDRKETTIRMAEPDFLKTNVKTVAIGVGRQTLYFFPDRLLVFDSGRVGAVGYNELHIHVSQTQFLENAAPRDAHVVGHTWQYVNKKGGPDRRFANNPQLSVCLYDELYFSSLSGLNEVIMVSRYGIGEPLWKAVCDLAQYTKYERNG